MDFYNLFNIYTRIWSLDSGEWLEMNNGHLYRRFWTRSSWERFYQNAADENFPDILY